MRRSRLLLLALLLVPSGALAQRGPLRGLDAYIARSVGAWKIPGLSIAIVKDDSVVFAKGYGVRAVGDPRPVDERTVFAIGSATKGFTTAALGVLVDQGRIRWDDPATSHLRGFQLWDPYATRELTIRDLLTHRSGLERGDLLWYASEFNREEVLRRVRFLEPSWGFRSQFGYQNIMFLAAGQVIPAVARRSWDEFVRQRILSPLGMSATSTSVLSLEKVGNLAMPHARIGGEVRPIAYRNIDNVAPAGSINSNALDMAQWVRLHLGRGTFRGTEVLKAATIEEMHTPQTVIRQDGSWRMMAPEARFLTYGMGWFLNDYRGRKVVQHGGNIDGMHALVAMMPEERLGLVILTNLGPNSLTYALMHRVFDAYLGAPPRDWSAWYLAQTDSLAAVAQAQQRKLEAARVHGTRPSLALDGYVGTYRSDMYGDARVERQGETLLLRRAGTLVADIQHWHYDTFRATWRDQSLGTSFLTFDLDLAARVNAMDVQGLGEFRRVADPPPATAGRGR